MYSSFAHFFLGCWANVGRIHFFWLIDQKNVSTEKNVVFLASLFNENHYYHHHHHYDDEYCLHNTLETRLSQKKIWNKHLHIGIV